MPTRSQYFGRVFCFVSFIVAANSASSFADSEIPGCPNLDLLDKATDITPESLNKLLLCFCKVIDREKVAVQCLYGSTIAQLEKVGGLVAKVNKTIQQISVQHMEFPEDGLKAELFHQIAPEIKSLEIRECSGGSALKIDPKTFAQLDDKLVNLTIHGCNLEEVPQAIETLANLELLDLTENKLYNLTKSPFSNKQKLKYLDISSNFINSIDEGTFAPLQSLQTIIIGDHNYMNESVLEELSNLKSLTSLDLSRADGIFSVPTDFLSNLPQLKTLKLGGCSIEAIDAGAFNALTNLEELDLRVNLITNVSAFAFDGLKKLKRISLAGNYIKRVEALTWDGLDSLEELDLGWNELKEMPNDTFNSLNKTLTKLNLRHNWLATVENITNLAKLREINLSESEYIFELGKNSFKNLPMLEILDLSNSNLSQIDPEAFENVKGSLRKLQLQKSKIKVIPETILTSLPSLEEIDVSGNPLICDDRMGNFIKTTKAIYKDAAKMGRNFFLQNQNETTCDRPYSMKDQIVFEVDESNLSHYDPLLDTTTAKPEITTTPDNSTVEETPSKIVLPDLFVGGESNDTFFKVDAPRPAYDVTKADDIALDSLETKEGGGIGIILALGGIALTSILALVAVFAYMKKKRQIGVSDGKVKKIEDGMVEIELNSNQGSVKRSNHPRREPPLPTNHHNRPRQNSANFSTNHQR
ncbi:unnamed protein product, partial [Mesorhabditis belari]|uniref:Uncharacterized protein n=1 Tax=Mesorhabditis belari TaxID=2138241 RepID=A0AAF3F5R2_9BILA